MSTFCTNPEAAMRVLNVMYTDPEVAQLCANGIEGLDYVLNDEGKMEYPNENGLSGIGWGAASMAFWPNVTLCPSWSYEDDNQYELMAISNNEIIDLSDYPNEFNPEDYFYDIETMQALEELYSQYDNAMNQEAMEPWKAYTDSTYQEHLVYDANARRAAREKMALTKRHKKPTMLLAAYGNGLISTDHNSTINSYTAQMLLPQPSGNQSGMILAPAAPGVTPRVSPPVNYNYHHHMPLTAGITFNKRIVGNLYGSVGFNFTSMSSDVTPDNGTGEFKQKVMLV